MARIVRDYTKSNKVDLLSFEAESFFLRLITNADDFGCYYGDERLLIASLYPLKIWVTQEFISDCIRECAEANLIHQYSHEDKQYLKIKDFRQNLRNKRSKFPEPIDYSEDLAIVFGYVYFIGTDFDSPIKIGFSSNPWARVNDLGVGTEKHLKVLLTFKAERASEYEYHKIFKQYNEKREWYSVPKAFVEFIQSQVIQENFSEKTLQKLLRKHYEELRSGLNPNIEPEVEPEVEKETELEKMVKRFFEYRKQIKHPIVDASKDLFLKKLENLSGKNEEVAIAILKQSMENSWRGIFALQNKNNVSKFNENKQQGTSGSREERVNSVAQVKGVSESVLDHLTQKNCG